MLIAPYPSSDVWSYFGIFIPLVIESQRHLYIVLSALLSGIGFGLSVILYIERNLATNTTDRQSVLLPFRTNVRTWSWPRQAAICAASSLGMGVLKDNSVES